MRALCALLLACALALTFAGCGPKAEESAAPGPVHEAEAPPDVSEKGAAVAVSGDSASARVAPTGDDGGGPKTASDRSLPGPENSLAIERSWSRVVVDAGHGGEDLGARGASGSFEKDITFAIARATTRALEARGYQVLETRSSDETLPLDRRTGLTNASGAGLLLSIHANSAPAAEARGLETYYMDLASDEAALRLAERENRAGRAAGTERRADVDSLVDDLRMGAVAVQSKVFAGVAHHRLVESLQEFYGDERVRDRGVRSAPFWVLVDAQVPAILVEVGYVTHGEEEKRLRTRAYHQRVSEALARAVDEFATRAAATDPIYQQRSHE